MRLVFIKYAEFPQKDNEWSFDGISLSQINLLVGKNATGKTRTLTLINSLADLITGHIPEIFQSGMYEAAFEHEEKTWKYFLEYDNSQVSKEELCLNDENVLHRGAGNIGRILAADIDDKPAKIKFQADARKVAILTKRDALQHSFLEPLHEWASSVRHFKFGGDMGGLAIAVKGVQIELNDRDTSQLIPIMNKALQKYKEEFKKSVITDMESLGYKLDDLEIRRPANAIIRGLIPGDLVGISAKETGLRSATDQMTMSQGMFRALSLLIQTTYYALEKKGGCIIIDDIGEGLDYERSCLLIDLLRKKALTSSMQLIMSTNNRFIMNKVPLEEWCVLHRSGNKVRGWNYANARDAFERFKITGLNNFDLLATDYVQKVKGDG